MDLGSLGAASGRRLRRIFSCPPRIRRHRSGIRDVRSIRPRIRGTDVSGRISNSRAFAWDASYRVVSGFAVAEQMSLYGMFPDAAGRSSITDGNVTTETLRHPQNYFMDKLERDDCLFSCHSGHGVRVSEGGGPRSCLPLADGAMGGHTRPVPMNTVVSRLGGLLNYYGRAA